MSAQLSPPFLLQTVEKPTSLCRDAICKLQYASLFLNDMWCEEEQVDLLTSLVMLPQYSAKMA